MNRMRVGLSCVFLCFSGQVFADEGEKVHVRSLPSLFDSATGVSVYEEGNPLGEEKESSLRRFDIAFFLSFPVFVLYNFIVHQLLAVYGNMSGNDGFLTAHQITYMGLSSTLLAFGVAYDDYLQVAAAYPEQSRLLGSPMVSVSWKIYF